MNKKVKIILGIVITLLIIWGVIFIIDYNRCANLKEPIFVIKGEILRDGGSYNSYGLGYNVKVKKTTSVEYGIQLEKVEMYIFGKCIAGAIADQNNNEIEINNEAMNDNSDKNYSFRAIVVNSSEKAIEVKPIEEKDIKLLSDRVSIGLGENNDMIYFKGAELLITYTGEIMDSYPTQIKVVNIQTETDYKAKIEELPKDYSLIQAIRDNCVISIHGSKVYNTDELDRFLENVKNNVPDFVRCINYTDEGDMIITDVNFEGSESFRICLDSTRDEYSSEKDRTYKYGKFTKYKIDESEERIAIYMEGPVEGSIGEPYIIGYDKNAEIINNYEFNYLLEVQKSENIEKKKITVDGLQNKYDYDIYYYGIDSATIEIDNQKMDLIEALRNDKVTMEKMIEQAEKDSKSIIVSDMYKEGGSMIYFYDSYTIIKRNSIDGDRDVYIGIPEMRLNDVER